MLKTIIVALATVAAAFPAEIKSAYASVDKNSPFQLDLRTQPLDNHSLFKKEAPDMHPVYKAGEARARIEELKSEGPAVIHNMLNDQPAPSTELNRIDNVQGPNYGFAPAQGHPEVAFPDIPYAPGYGYDNVYAPSNSYDIYGNGLASFYPEPEPASLFGLIWSQVPDARGVANFVGRTLVWFFNSAFILALGSFLTVAVCSYTNLCSIAFHGVGPIREEMRSLMSPERLERISHAADFVKNAIDKYQKIQKVSEIANSKR